MTNRIRTQENQNLQTADMYMNLNGSPYWGPYNITSNRLNAHITDVVTSRFHERVAEGEIINNPMQYVKDTIESSVGGRITSRFATQDYESSGGGCLSAFLAQWLADIGQGYNVADLLTVPEPNFDMSTAAKVQCLSRIDSTPYSFGEDIGELRETIEFMKNPAKSLRDLTRAFNKDAWKRLRKLNLLSGKQLALKRAQAIADVWKSYSFAAAPLVRSWSDLGKAAAENTKRPERRTARGKSEFTDAISEYSNFPNYAWSTTVKTEQTIRTGVLYEHSNPINDWKFKYGLRLKDAPETYWQLLPLSFMVDRVYNLSHMLKALTNLADPNVTILAAWSTTKREVEQTRKVENYTHPSALSTSLSPDIERYKTFSYNRVVWEPTISDAVPPFRKDQLVDSASKVADLASIILGFVKF